MSGGSYPVAHIRGINLRPNIRGTIAGRLLSGGIYPGTYIRGIYIQGLYPGTYIRGLIFSDLYPGGLYPSEKDYEKLHEYFMKEILFYFIF